jgi:hypothetical protein
VSINESRGLYRKYKQVEERLEEMLEGREEDWTNLPSLKRAYEHLGKHEKHLDTDLELWNKDEKTTYEVYLGSSTYLRWSFSTDAMLVEAGVG